MPVATRPQPVVHSPDTAPTPEEAPGIRPANLAEAAAMYAGVQALYGRNRDETDHPLLQPTHAKFDKGDGHTLYDEIWKPNNASRTMYYGEERDVILAGLRAIAHPRSGSDHQLKAGLMLGQPSARRQMKKAVRAQELKAKPGINIDEGAKEEHFGKLWRESAPAHVLPPAVISAAEEETGARLDPKQNPAEEPINAELPVAKRGFLPRLGRSKITLPGFSDLVTASVAVNKFGNPKYDPLKMIDKATLSKADAEEKAPEGRVVVGKPARAIRRALQKAAERSTTPEEKAAALLLEKGTSMSSAQAKGVIKAAPGMHKPLIN